MIRLIKVTPLSGVSGMSNSNEASWSAQGSGRLRRSNTSRFALECLSVAGEKQVWNTLLKPVVKWTEMDGWLEFVCESCFIPVWSQLAANKLIRKNTLIYTHVG